MRRQDVRSPSHSASGTHQGLGGATHRPQLPAQATSVSTSFLKPVPSTAHTHSSTMLSCTTFSPGVTVRLPRWRLRKCLTLRTRTVQSPQHRGPSPGQRLSHLASAPGYGALYHHSCLLGPEARLPAAKFQPITWVGIFVCETSAHPLSPLLYEQAPLRSNTLCSACVPVPSVLWQADGLLPVDPCGRRCSGLITPVWGCVRSDDIGKWVTAHTTLVP